MCSGVFLSLNLQSPSFVPSFADLLYMTLGLGLEKSRSLEAKTGGLCVLILTLELEVFVLNKVYFTSLVLYQISVSVLAVGRLCVDVG